MTESGSCHRHRRHRPGSCRRPHRRIHPRPLGCPHPRPPPPPSPPPPPRSPPPPPPPPNPPPPPPPPPPRPPKPPPPPPRLMPPPRPAKTSDGRARIANEAPRASFTRCRVMGLILA